MKKHIVSITFELSDDEPPELFAIMTPDEVPAVEIKFAIRDTHILLFSDEGSTVNNEKIMEYLRKKYGWNWYRFHPDIEVVLP